MTQEATEPQDPNELIQSGDSFNDAWDVGGSSVPSIEAHQHQKMEGSENQSNRRWMEE